MKHSVDLRNIRFWLTLISIIIIVKGCAEVNLITAARSGDVAKANRMLKKGANPNFRNVPGWTALMFAASGSYPIAEALIKNGADVNAKAGNGNTPLIVAAGHGQLDIAELLIANGANVYAKNEAGETPLILAKRLGYQKIKELLIFNGADPEEKKISGSRRIIKPDEFSESKKLSNKDSEKNTKDNEGNTYLMQAVNQGRKNMVKSLLANGADVNAINNKGWTALMMAASKDKGHIEITEILLANGADVNATNNEGTTSLMIAAVEGHIGIAEILLANGADINVSNKQSMTALLGAASNGRTEMVKLLLENDADVRRVDSKGWTASKVAREKKYFDTANIIYEEEKKVYRKILQVIKEVEVEVRQVDIIESVRIQTGEVRMGESREIFVTKIYKPIPGNILVNLVVTFSNNSGLAIQLSRSTILLQSPLEESGRSPLKLQDMRLALLVSEDISGLWPDVGVIEIGKYTISRMTFEIPESWRSSVMSLIIGKVKIVPISFT